MSIRSLAFFPCEMLLADPETQAASAINIIEDVTFARFPAGFGRLSLFAMLERESAETANEKISIDIKISFNGQQVADQKQDVVFPGSARKTKVRLFMNGLGIQTPGTVVFELGHEGKTIATYLIQAAALPEQPKA